MRKLRPTTPLHSTPSHLACPPACFARAPCSPTGAVASTRLPALSPSPFNHPPPRPAAPAAGGSAWQLGFPAIPPGARDAGGGDGGHTAKHAPGGRRGPRRGEGAVRASHVAVRESVEDEAQVRPPPLAGDSLLKHLPSTPCRPDRYILPHPTPPHPTQLLADTTSTASLITALRRLNIEPPASWVAALLEASRSALKNRATDLHLANLAGALAAWGVKPDGRWAARLMWRSQVLMQQVGGVGPGGGWRGGDAEDGRGGGARRLAADTRSLARNRIPVFLNRAPLVLSPASSLGSAGPNVPQGAGGAAAGGDGGWMS